MVKWAKWMFAMAAAASLLHADPAQAADPAVPPGFEPGQGAASFAGRTPDGAAFLTDSGTVLRLGRGEAVRLRPRGARAGARTSAGDRLPGVVNRIHGDDPSKWRLGLPLYGRVRRHGVYRGIDLVHHFRSGALEYDWIVAPGASARTIDLAVDGGRRLRLGRRGDLLVHTREGVLRQRRPVAYQRVAGRRRAVRARFVLRGKRRVGFAVGRYDRTKPLVIDPEVTFSTYVGGTGDDGIADVATDPQGNVYISGGTTSLDFPVKDGPDSGCGSDGGCDAYLYYDHPEVVQDAFVAKLTAGGTLVYATYIGGRSSETARVAVDSAGRAHLYGQTYSADFPTTPGSFRPQRSACLTWATCETMFVTRLSATGGTLDWSTYFGGGTEDYPQDVAVDAQGGVYVTGIAESPSFPTTPGALGASARFPYGDSYGDAFVTKLKADGTGLAYSGVFGGRESDSASAIALTAQGEAYVAGWTTSPDFVTTEGAAQRVCDGPNASYCDNSDGFVLRIPADGAAITHSTRLGGRWGDSVLAIDIDGQGRPVVAGGTDSEDFPRAVVLDGKREDYSGFVSRLTATLSSVEYSGILSGDVVPRDLALAADGGAYVAGSTRAAELPVRDAVQPVPGSKACYATGGGCYDAFAARLAPDGNAIAWATYLGGSGGDDAHSVARAGNGVVVGGSTTSTDLPTRNAIDPTLGDGTCRRAQGYCRQDGFVTRIDEAATTGSAYDGFDRRRPLNWMSGSVLGDSTGAAGGTVWFEWTAPANRTVAFDTIGSAYDTTLTVYRGSAAGSLTQVAAGDDYAGLTASRVVFRAVRGRTYKLALGAKGSGGGRFELAWEGAPPFNDDFTRAQAISGTSGTAGGSTVYATMQEDESTSWDVGPPTIWYRWTAPQDGIAIFDTKGSDGDNSVQLWRGDHIALLEHVPGLGLGVYEVVAGQSYKIRVAPMQHSGVGDVALNWRYSPRPANDDLAAAEVITGTSGRVDGEAWMATRELQEPGHAGPPESGPGKSVWFRWTAPADGAYNFNLSGAWWRTLAIYTGTGYGDLVQVARLPGDPLRLGTEAGKTYLIAVDAGGSFSLTWAKTPSPANDLYAYATPLAQAGGALTALNAGASHEAGETKPGGPTVWYSWTAPASGPVAFATEDPFAAGLGIYTGDSVKTAVLVAETPSSNPTLPLVVQAVAGTEYRVALRGGSRPRLAWDFGAPANDAFASAQGLTGTSGFADGSIANATSEAGEPAGTERSVWYSWTAPASGPIKFNLRGGDLETAYVTIWTGSTVGSLTQQAWDNGGEATVTATSGTTYRIRVASGYPHLLPFRLGWNRAAAETVPPEVELLDPPEGAHVRGPDVIQAYARDRHGIKLVEFLVNGVVVGQKTSWSASYPYDWVDWDTTKLPDGPVQVAARATDNYDNVATTPAVGVIVDNTAPQTAIASAPQGTVSSRTATVKFTAGEAIAQYTCRLDEEYWFPCDETLIIEHLEDGPHAIEVVSRDLAGNGDTIPARHTWRVEGDETQEQPAPEPTPEPDPELPPEPTPEPSPEPTTEPKTPPTGGGTPLGGGSGTATETPPGDTGTSGGFLPLPAGGGTIVSSSPDGELRLTAYVARGRVSGAALRRGLPVRVSCSAACTARARLTLSARDAKRAGLRPGTIARASRRLAKGARPLVRLRPSRRVAAALGRRRGLRVGLVIDATAADGTRVTIRRALTIR
jgi:hypothetical protein